MTDFRGKSTQPKKIRSKWYQRLAQFVVQLVSRFFSLIKFIIRILWDIVSHVMSTIAFFFSFFLKTVADPSFPCVVAIILFLVVVGITGSQWWQMGSWAGKALDFPNVFGVEAALVGLLIGLGINTFQLAPELWKLRQDVISVYKELKVDVEIESPEEESIEDRQLNWFSYSHKGLKAGRLLSYGIEAFLVLLFVALAQSFAFWGILSGAISLLVPEQSVKILSYTVNLLGTVSNKLNEEPETTTVRQKPI